MAVAVVLGVADLLLGELGLAFLAVLQIAAFGTALALFHRSHRLDTPHRDDGDRRPGRPVREPDPGRRLSWGAANLIWIILVPIAAVLFLGARAGPPALAGVVIVVAAGVVIDPFVRTAAARAIARAGSCSRRSTLIVPAAIALGLVVFIDGERVRAKAESDALLLNVLPRSIADRLKRGERVIADHYDEVTVLFADVVDFTPFAAQETPARVVAVLNEVFSRFDTLAERHGLEKIKTIGDAYMVVAGAPEPRADHAAVIVDMALEMLAVAASIEPLPGAPCGSGSASRPDPPSPASSATGSSATTCGATPSTSPAGWSRPESPGRSRSRPRPGGCAVIAIRSRPRDVEVKGLGTLRTYLLDPSATQA